MSANNLENLWIWSLLREAVENDVYFRADSENDNYVYFDVKNYLLGLKRPKDICAPKQDFDILGWFIAQIIRWPTA